MSHEFRSGDLVRVTGVPPPVATMPAETRRIFACLVGQVLRVVEVDAGSGDLVLNVRDDGSQGAGWDEHTLSLDPAYADLVTRPPA